VKKPPDVYSEQDYKFFVLWKKLCFVSREPGSLSKIKPGGSYEYKKTKSAPT
jgi:hypothetical protein